ncbi:MAG TPA: FG-GAP-like repeat-containing protein [Dehalococcoidia bacterium]|nr:FG-GAP-like repeat-containing protein [Dehalococcoidia bacterium]
MFRSLRIIRLGALGLGIAAAAALTGLFSAPDPAAATHGCAGAGSPTGPWSLTAFEAADWRTTYGRTLELAAFNRLFPELPSFALPSIETGPRSAGSTTAATPYVPPTLLKAIAWVESGWQMANSSVNYGETGPPLLSHSCGYGIMQIVSGMENAGGAPTLNQVSIGSHYGLNIARGARILAQKWNLAPEYRPLAGSRNAAAVEDWYYAVWSYHGFSFTNHPLNPAYSPRRGVYRCDGTQSYGSFPYQELVLGCMTNPPVVGGTRLWTAIAPTFPNPSLPAFSLSNWNACSGSSNCAGMDLPASSPAHTDPTTTGLNRTAALGAPSVAVSPASINLVVPSNATSPSMTATISNPGTGPLSWRLSPSVSWLKPAKIQGLSTGTDIGSAPASFSYSVDATGLVPGNYTGAINIQSNYAQGLPKSLTVNLSVAPLRWALSSSQMRTADVNGDGKADVVGIADNGGGLMRFWNFVSNGTDFSSVRRSYSGCSDCWELGQSQMLVADVNGDGKDDIVGVYDYGDGTMGMWNFISNGTSFATVRRSYTGCNGCWDLGQSRMLAADVNGDGKDDIVGIYDYGEGNMTLWNFISDGSTFTKPYRSFRGCPGCWQLGSSQMVAADVTGDEKDDIVGIYDYGGGVIRMWNFASDGIAFRAARQSYQGCDNCWNLSQSLMLGGDLNGDGKDDVLGIYDYGGGLMGMWNYLSDGESFSSVLRSYRGCSGCWDLSRSQMMAGDVDADGETDVVGAYDYGSAVMGMWHFMNGSEFVAHRSY